MPPQATVSIVTTLMDSSIQEHTSIQELLLPQVETSGQAWEQEGCWDICLAVRGELKEKERKCCSAAVQALHHPCICFVETIHTTTTTPPTVTADLLLLPPLPPPPLGRELLQVRPLVRLPEPHEQHL